MFVRFTLEGRDRQQLKLRGIEVVQELQEGMPRILADSSRLEQVFINLLVNSRDAIDGS